LSQEANIQSDPYLYPDTSVVRNLADIRDANRLNQFESDHLFARLLELHPSPIRGSFDSDHLKHIHKYVFQDVYARAGEFRTVPIAKGNSFSLDPSTSDPSGTAEAISSTHRREVFARERFCWILPPRRSLPWRDQRFAREDWLMPNVILTLFLPALLFERTLLSKDVTFQGSSWLVLLR
jgi:hypothetical protein